MSKILEPLLYNYVIVCRNTTTPYSFHTLAPRHHYKYLVFALSTLTVNFTDVFVILNTFYFKTIDIFR